MEFIDTERVMAAARGLEDGTLQLPSEIRQLRERIDGEIRALELNASITNEVDQERVEEITRMRLELDSLYCSWIESLPLVVPV